MVHVVRVAQKIRAKGGQESEVTKGATILKGITLVSQLKWYHICLLQTYEGTQETMRLCQILSREEAAGYRHLLGSDKENTREKQL